MVCAHPPACACTDARPGRCGCTSRGSTLRQVALGATPASAEGPSELRCFSRRHRSWPLERRLSISRCLHPFANSGWTCCFSESGARCVGEGVRAPTSVMLACRGAACVPKVRGQGQSGFNAQRAENGNAACGSTLVGFRHCLGGQGKVGPCERVCPGGERVAHDGKGPPDPRLLSLRSFGCVFTLCAQWVE